MNTAAPTPPDDESGAARSEEIARRLDALKRSAETAAKAGDATDALPNLSAQKLLTMHARIDARHAQIMRTIADGNAATKAEFVAMGEDLKSLHRQILAIKQQGEEVSGIRVQLAELDRVVSDAIGEGLKIGIFMAASLLLLIAVTAGGFGGLFQ